MQARMLGLEGGPTSANKDAAPRRRSHLDWRKEQVQARTLGLNRVDNTLFVLKLCNCAQSYPHGE